MSDDTDYVKVLGYATGRFSAMATATCLAMYSVMTQGPYSQAARTLRARAHKLFNEMNEVIEFLEAMEEDDKEGRKNATEAFRNQLRIWQDNFEMSYDERWNMRAARAGKSPNTSI